ncbi:hypothetical protein ACN469_31785 [Corallococcus terminator]
MSQEHLELSPAPRFLKAHESTHPMNTDLVELVSRQLAFLLRQSDTAFLRELRRTIDALRREPRIAAILDDEKQSAARELKEFAQQCADHARELSAIKDEFITLCPTSDDSDTERPTDFHWGDPWLDTFSCFNAITKGESVQVIPDMLDWSPPASLLIILRRRIEHLKVTTNNESLRENLEALEERRAQLATSHTRAWRLHRDTEASSPGVAVLYIESFLDHLISDRYHTLTPSIEHYREVHNLPHPYMLHKFLYEKSTTADKQELTMAVTALKETLDRLSQIVITRIGTARSLLAVFDRFKIRCEWHDRRRMSALADEMAEEGKKSQTETILTEELVRYLFDQGLNPISEVPTAGLRPDILEPTRLYVEAKQYKGNSPRSYLIRGIHQMHETIGRLRGSHYAIREAFFVVFRRAGPLVDLPEKVVYGDWTLYPRLIDLAPSDSSGSRASPRISIMEADFHPKEASTEPTIKP